MIGWTRLFHCVLEELNPQECRLRVADNTIDWECVNDRPEEGLRTEGLWEEMSQTFCPSQFCIGLLFVLVGRFMRKSPL